MEKSVRRDVQVRIVQFLIVVSFIAFIVLLKKYRAILETELRYTLQMNLSL